MLRLGYFSQTLAGKSNRSGPVFFVFVLPAALLWGKQAHPYRIIPVPAGNSSIDGACGSLPLCR